MWTDITRIGRANANPLPTYLRVPLTWYQSTTHSYFPDEDAPSIRRVYTSPHDPSSLRHFCGFCGTPLAYWSESPSTEARFISLTLGSLSGEDLRDLEELGLLPESIEQEIKLGKGAGKEVSQHEDQGIPWFETLVSESGLGKLRRSAGGRKSRSWRVEWEIVEFEDGEGEESEQATAAVKRKLGEVEVEDKDTDATMEGVH
jgi:hypothetical protein